MTGSPDVRLRDVLAEDLPVFFEMARDPESVRMAAFTPADPDDRDAFFARSQRLLGDPTVRMWTVLADGEVAGSALTYVDEERTDVSFWIGRAFWGRGVATAALQALLREVPERPLYARAAADNAGSLRVLEKCGFLIVGEDEAFANGRGEVTAEYVLELAAPSNRGPLVAGAVVAVLAVTLAVMLIGPVKQPAPLVPPPPRPLTREQAADTAAKAVLHAKYEISIASVSVVDEPRFNGRRLVWRVTLASDDPPLPRRTVVWLDAYSGETLEAMETLPGIR